MFALAAGAGALAVPVWVALRAGGGPSAPADWHGYEMLFGYALAVVAGFLIGPVPRWAVVLLATSWSAAQLAGALAPFGWLHAACSALFALTAAVLAAPKLFRGPSKLANRVFGPVVILLCVDAAVAPFAPALRARLLVAGLDLFTVLLVFMGGRIIAAAAAGQYYRRGERLDTRVQPRIEGVALVLLLLLAWNDVLAGSDALGSALALAAAGVLTVRWLRWRLWTCRGAWNLLALGVAYLWLPLGLAIRASWTLPVWTRPFDALHGLTAGALGSLTLLVMGRTRLMASGRDPERSRVLAAAGLAVSAAASLRLLAGVRALGGRAPLLLAAGAAWGLAFLALGGLLARLPRGPARNR